MTAGGDLSSKRKARGGIQRLRDGVNELRLETGSRIIIGLREAGGGGFEEREAEFLLAAAAPRVNR